MNDFQPYSYTDEVTADRPWLASLVGVQDTNTITLDLAAFTVDTHYTASTTLAGRNVMKSGIPLGRVTATNLYAPYASGAVDGTENLAGFLVNHISFNTGSTKASGALLWFGEVYPDDLPVTFDEAAATNAPGVTIHYRYR